MVTEQTGSRVPRRARRVIVWWALAVVVALAAGVLLGRWAFAPPTVTDVAREPATVEVVEMTVGQSVPLAVSASWSSAPFGVGAAEGTLTSLDVRSGDEVMVGQQLYSVDLRPVVAGRGAIPAFRDLSDGSRGADVAQLQLFLADLGLLPTGSDDGVFGPATTAAVKTWQHSIGVTRDGVVRASDIVFAPELPTRVQVADGMTVGRRVVAGDAVLSALGVIPEFVAVVQNGAAFDRTAPILVTFGDEQVEAVVERVRGEENGNTYLVLTRPDGSSICGEACGSVPLEPQEAVYPSRQVVIPEVTGPGVPAAAVDFDASGAAFLTGQDGTRIAVTIQGQGQGRVVVEGAAVGTVVRLPDADSQDS